MENPRVKNQEKPIIYPYVSGFERRNERCSQKSHNRHTDIQTHRHTDTDTQDKYSNPPAHARRGLINCDKIYIVKIIYRSSISIKRDSTKQ